MTVLQNTASINMLSNKRLGGGRSARSTLQLINLALNMSVICTAQVKCLMADVSIGRQGILQSTTAKTCPITYPSETFESAPAWCFTGFNSPLHRTTVEEQSQKINSIDLIKEEIAIMKKLNHPNLVSLIEVLDDPTEDSLYMVMEMCKKGVVMRVGLEERADPYPDHVCRYWFRDLILGIEYLHAQGVVHRDIKPDNCLVTDDDVLKVVDFGVSEMFSKDSEMRTAKSAGSPAFLPRSSVLLVMAMCLAEPQMYGRWV